MILIKISNKTEFKVSSFFNLILFILASSHQSLGAAEAIFTCYAKISYNKF